MKWTIGDWVMAAVCVVAIALSVWGAIAAEAMPARIASIGTAAAFTLAIGVLLWIRLSSGRHDTIGAYGVRIKWGRRNRTSLATVNQWIEEVVRLWVPKYQLRVTPALEDRLIVFVDAERIGVAGRWVRGYALGDVGVVGIRDGGTVDGYVRSLFIHELSHLVLAGVGEPWDETIHHKLMREAGIG
jgi:hypothetical protein